ncbi:hypothetical protein ACQX0K_10665, partial [Corynebacterium diphtheriae]
MRNRIPHTNHQTPSFSKTLINFSYGSSPLVRAGVQFSKTLIDFLGDFVQVGEGWGSVLKNPDRLHSARVTLPTGWGSVLKNPDRLLNRHIY